MNATPNPQCYLDCISLYRLIQAVSRLALQRGYDGDPLADPVPQPQFESQLVAAGEIWLSLPVELRHLQGDLARQFCKAAVFGSRQHRHAPSCTAVPGASATDAKLARERRSVQTRRAS